jgi:hypothetical protein
LRVTTISSSRSATPDTSSGSRVLTSEMGMVFDMVLFFFLDQNSGLFIDTPPGRDGQGRMGSAQEGYSR